jgi:hypothetical protein
LLVLHPGLKLEYFKQQGWEDEWVDNAKNLVHEEYSVNYEGKESSISPAPVPELVSFLYISCSSDN